MFTRAQVSGEIERHGLWPSDRNADIRNLHAPAAGSILNLERRHLERQTGLMRGDVVARERVVGPAGEQQRPAVR